MSRPFTVKTEVLEASTEAKAIRQAEAAGWWVRKFKSSIRGVPDRIFAKRGAVVFIEFKRARRGRVSALQDREIAKMEAAGLRVYTCRTVEEVMTVLRDAEAFSDA